LSAGGLIAEALLELDQGAGKVSDGRCGQGHIGTSTTNRILCSSWIFNI
jgi:hypothetical protein